MSVTVEGLVVSYGQRKVLNGVSCAFNAGTLTALIGPSGTGKSTLLGVLSGAVRASAGNVTVDGQEPHPARTVWVPQGSNALGARTALDNVKLAPLSERKSILRSHAIARKMLRDVGLGPHELTLAKHLSGGELQRLAFARALASSRPLILADEPTANLDLAATNDVIALMKRIKTRRTVIVATHDPEVVGAADEVVDLRAINLGHERS